MKNTNNKKKQGTETGDAFQNVNLFGEKNKLIKITITH